MTSRDGVFGAHAVIDFAALAAATTGVTSEVAPSSGGVLGACAVARFAAVAQLAGTGDLATLTARERERHGNLRRSEDRAAYLAAHLMVRECAGQILDIPSTELELLQRCPGCGSTEHGRPYIAAAPQLTVSLSHSRGHVAAVAADRNCGIDVETLDRGGSPRGALSQRELAWLARQPDQPLAFRRLWVRKEALIKCGVLSLGELEQIDVLDRAAVAPSNSTRGYRLFEWAQPGAVGAWALAE